jgi:hypothetical protein
MSEAGSLITSVEEMEVAKLIGLNLFTESSELAKLGF